jgi:hypothetical protein
MATNKRKRPAKVSEKLPEVTSPSLEEAIAKRAYELYCARGAGDGSDMDDWLQAERELCGTNPAPE